VAKGVLDGNYMISKPTKLRIRGIVTKCSAVFSELASLMTWAPRPIRAFQTVKPQKFAQEFRECENKKACYVLYKDEYYVIYHPEECADHIHVFNLEGSQLAHGQATRIANEFIQECLQEGLAKQC